MSLRRCPTMLWTSLWLLGDSVAAFARRACVEVLLIHRGKLRRDFFLAHRAKGCNSRKVLGSRCCFAALPLVDRKRTHV